MDQTNTIPNLNRLLDHDPLKVFLQRCQDLVDKGGLGREVLSIQTGSKYHKIISTEGNRHRVFAFINKATGDILKPASFMAPAKHARGNIHDDSGGMDGMTSYGPKYLK